MVQAAEPWAEAPLRQFIDDARVRIAVLMQPSGQVLAQAGFARATDVMSACALASAINASSSELGRQLEGKPFSGLHVAGREHQVFLGRAPSARGDLLLLCVFDSTTSLGLVQVFFDEFRVRLAALGPAEAIAPPRLSADFEADLNRNLAALFGRI
jgi:predicted regulator of Ras-like GTPase activity (Roadblock/LC7/MglB family)